MIHLDIIQMTVGADEAAEESDISQEDGDSKMPSASKTAKKEVSEDVAVLQTECLVLLQMLCDFNPKLRDELDIFHKKSVQERDDIACVELIWHGVLQRRFFHIPSKVYTLSLNFHFH